MAETSEDDGSPFSSLEVEFVRIPQIIVCSRLNSHTSSCCSVAILWLSECINYSENYMKPASFNLFPVFSVF